MPARTFCIVFLIIVGSLSLCFFCISFPPLLIFPSHLNINLLPFLLILSLLSHISPEQYQLSFIDLFLFFYLQCMQKKNIFASFVAIHSSECNAKIEERERERNCSENDNGKCIIGTRKDNFQN